MQQIRAERSISFIEARKLAIAESSTTSQGPLPKVVLSAQAHSARPVSHRDMAVQTDLTWPNSAQHPTKVEYYSRASKSTDTSSDISSADTAKQPVSDNTDDLPTSRKGGKVKSTQPKITVPTPTTFGTNNGYQQVCCVGIYGGGGGSSHKLSH